MKVKQKQRTDLFVLWHDTLSEANTAVETQKLRHNNALDRTCGGACVAGPSCAVRTVHSNGKYVIERER